MKKLLLLPMLLSAALAFTACNNQPKKEEQKGVDLQGKQGGDMEINKKKFEIDGKNGGKLKMDSNGVKVK